MAMKTLRKMLLALCLLCSVLATTEARAELNLTNPKVRGNPAFVPDLAADPAKGGGALKRYGAGWQRVPKWHVGVIPEVDQTVLNERISSGSLNATEKAVFAKAGLSGLLTYRDWLDLHMFLYDGQRTYAEAILDSRIGEREPPPQQAPPQLQPDRVREILLSAGDWRGLVPNEVDRIAKKLYETHGNAAGSEQALRAEVGPAFPERWGIPEEALALHDEYEAAFREAIDNPARREAIRAEQKARLQALRDLVTPPPGAGSTGPTIDPGLALATIAYSERALAVPDVGAALDSALKVSPREADALSDPTRLWVIHVFDTNRVIQ